jgi:hypothetical protein
MGLYKLGFPMLLAFAIAGCASLHTGGSSGRELDRLGRLAEALQLDMHQVQKSGSERNFAGMRSEHVLLSERLDSRTYFVEDDRFQAGAGVFAGSDEELLQLSRQVMRDLEIPAGEIAGSAVLAEKLMTARYDAASKTYVPGEVQAGRRFVELTRSVDGVPVFSSRGFMGFTRDKAVGSLEVHWPQISEETLKAAQRLQTVVRQGWEAPHQKGGVVESIEAGIIHSPAIGFVMDVQPVIRVIYASEDKSVGRKAVLYLDDRGNAVPIPRTFEKIDEKPPGERKEPYPK